MSAAVALIEQWRAEAALFRRRGQEDLANLTLSFVEDLEAALKEDDDQLLTLGEAAQVSGYSEDHLGRLVRDGKLVNVGRKHAPRIRRGDLPRRVADRRSPGYDPRTDARDLLQK
jgi:hypothetical protein